MGRKEADAVEYTLRKIANAVRDTYGKGWPVQEYVDISEYDMDVAWTFEDAVIAKDYVSGNFFEIPYLMVGDDVVLDKPVQVENYYILKRLADENPEITMKDAAKILDGMMAATKSGAGVELTGPIVFKNEPERIAFAAVLVPGEPDLDFDQGEKILTKEEVERVANQWLADYGNIDLMHSLNNVAVPVQSYTTYSERVVKVNGEDLVLPEGTWILGSRLNEETWDAVVKGQLTGYSVMGIRRTVLKNLASAEKSSAEACLKKTLIKDLGPDWVAPFVSVVDTPAVPKSKWFALKSAGDKMNANAHSVTSVTADPKPWYQRLFGPAAEKEGRRFSDSTYQQMKLISQQMKLLQDTLKVLIEEAETERKGKVKLSSKQHHGNPGEEVKDLDEKEIKNLVSEVIKEAMPEALKDMSDRLGKLEKPEPKSDPNEEFRAEILKRLEKLEKKPTSEEISKALKGQDGADGSGSVSKAEEDDRDLYGRKRKNR